MKIIVIIIVIEFFKYFLRFIPNRLINLFFVGKRYKIDNFIFEENLFNKKNFDKSIKSNKTNYLIGYWQNKKYFAKYYEIIKHELKPVFINKHVHKFIKKCPIRINHTII